MSRAIIAALRQQRQLRTITRTIAIEIAHRMSSSGVGRIAYSFLASKAACSVRTAIRHVKRLVALGLFRKRHTHTPAGYGWNVYEYTGPRLQRPPASATTRYDWVTEKDPQPAGEEAKVLALGKQIAHLQVRLSELTTGSHLWTIFQEDLEQLLALQHSPGEEAVWQQDRV